MVRVTCRGFGHDEVDEYPHGDSFEFLDGILYIRQDGSMFAAYLVGHVVKVEIEGKGG